VKQDSTLSLFAPSDLPQKIRLQSASSSSNRLDDADRAVHDWYRFVLSFPPHLVRTYLDRFGVGEDGLVLDPFCGTGTTVVECKKLGISSTGIEGNPVAHFACSVKTDWRPQARSLRNEAKSVLNIVSESTDDKDDLLTLPQESMQLLLTNSISPIPLHKVLSIRNAVLSSDLSCTNHLLIALAKTAVATASNLKFGPEVGVDKIKEDAPVIEDWLNNVESIAGDLENMTSVGPSKTNVVLGDARGAPSTVAPSSIDAVFTSPPYPNEKDYTRTTRLEMVLLNFASSKLELQALKKGLIRSNTRGVYKHDNDDDWVRDFPAIDKIACDIERRRIELGKTSGFERMYARVTKLYFGGMARHLAELRPYLRSGAHLAYVVGDQASFLRIMIRTGQELMKIAEHLGYEPLGIDLFRTRLATATGEQLREEVIILKWPG
jgi:DNA modification methylase